MGGNVRNCPPGGHVCTRNDPLSAGMNYPDLTVTVNVLSNAPSTVSNQVIVSGGGISGSLVLTDPTRSWREFRSPEWR